MIPASKYQDPVYNNRLVSRVVKFTQEFDDALKVISTTCPIKVEIPEPHINTAGYYSSSNMVERLGRLQEKRRWCAENITGYWTEQYPGDNTNGAVNAKYWAFQFMEDAILFKLTWYDCI